MNAVTVSPGNFSTPPVYNPPPTAPGWPPSGGAVPARRGSGVEAMAAVFAGLALTNFIALYLRSPYQPLFGDGALARFIIEFLFGDIWYIIVGFVLCLRHRAAAGSAVVLFSVGPHVTTYVIGITQNDYVSVDGDTEFTTTVIFAVITAVALFGAFIMNLLGGPGGAGIPPKPLQLSEAALAYCIVAGAIGLFNGIHALMGYPLFGRGVMEAGVPPMMMAVYACDAIVLILGIGAIVVLRSRRSRGAYAGLLAGQAISWAAAVALNYVWLVNDFYHRFYPAVMVPGIIVAVIVLVFALMAGAPSVGQWFAGVPAPVAGMPAPGVNVGGPVMVAAPAPVAVPQQVLGADGRMYTVMTAAPAPIMGGGAPGFAGGAFAPAAAPAPFPQAAAPSAPAVASAPAVPSGAAAPAPAPSSQSAASAAPPLVGYGSSSGSAPSSA